MYKGLFKVDSIRNKALSILTKILKVDDSVLSKIGDDEDLCSYGLNSIGSIQLIVLLEEEYGIEFEDVDLMIDKVNTIDKIRKALEKYI